MFYKHLAGLQILKTKPNQNIYLIQQMLLLPLVLCDIWYTVRKSTEVA